MSDLTVKYVATFGDTIMATMDTKCIIWVGIRWIRHGIGILYGQHK